MLTRAQSVLDVSNRATISTVADIDLSRDEDSVQSLGSLATRDGLIAFAGINSSQADQDAGKNEHLRSFDITYPPRKKQRTEKSDGEDKGEIKPIGKRALFKPSRAAKKETYQRVLRLSPAQKRDSGSKRIGAVATGMAKSNEVVVFSATSATPDDTDVITRIELPGGAEAADLDIANTGPSEFSIAYCTDNDIYEQTIRYDFANKKAEKTPNGPRRVHQMPFPDAFENPKSRPKNRCLRFLNSQNIITLANKPNKGGAELQIIHLYPTGPASLQLTKSLPKRIRQAVSMDVCALDIDKSGNQQLAIAVAGQDISIEVYTTNYQRKTATFSPFKHYITLRDVHQHQMTKLCFSPFHSPIRAPDPEPPATGPNGEPVQQRQAAEPPSHPQPQYIRLASVTYGNTVVVDTFPLSPLEPADKHSRYVLSHPSDEQWVTYTYIALISAIVLIAAFLIQSFVTGFADGSTIGPFSFLPKNVRTFLDQPAAAARGVGQQARYTVSSAVEESFPTNMPGKARLREMLSEHDPASGKALVVRDAGDSTSLSVDVHPDKEAYLKEDTEARHWHQLNEHQQTAWRERLVRAGEWVEGQGENVLAGVLFSEYAGMVGQALRG